MESQRSPLGTVGGTLMLIGNGSIGHLPGPCPLHVDGSQTLKSSHSQETASLMLTSDVIALIN